MYDERLCLQLARLPCKNRNDWYEIDSDLASLFYRIWRIKRVPSWRNFIADLFHGLGQIKRHHRWQMFMRSKKYKKTKSRKEWDRVWGYLVTHEVLIYFNIFDCGRNLLSRIDVTHERAWMATTKEKYYTMMLENLVDYNDRNNAPFSNEKLRQAVSKVMS